MTVSVVRSRAATEAAFSSAERVTLAGSMMPHANRSPYSPVARRSRSPAGSLRTASTTTEPSCAGVDRDLAERLFQRAAQDVDADRLVTEHLDLVERRDGVDEDRAATGDHALLDARAGRRQRVLDAVLLLLQLDLGGRADLEHRDAAGELGEPLLELLAVEVDWWCPRSGA